MSELNSGKIKQTTWLVGDWHYWPSSGLLKHSKTEHRLSIQLNEVFLLLVENAGEVVTRQQFLAQVWRNKYVNEDALSRTIAELRKILGDSASEAKYIKTIPKTGYQLKVLVEPVLQRNNRRIKLGMATLALFILLLVGYYWSQQVPLVTQLQDAVANAHRMTAKPGMEQQSILSPDGQWLSYVTLSDQGSQIVIRSLTDINDLTSIELARHQLSSPVYLPEKNLLFFVARDRVDCYLKSYDMIEKTFMDLGTCFFDAESRVLDWDSESQQLLYADKEIIDEAGERVSIYQKELLSGNTVKLTAPPSNDSKDWSPRISPNQAYLSFSRGNQAVRNLWLKDLSSGVEMPLTTGEHYSVSHDWYDNEHIVLDSDLSGSRQLWLINIHNKQMNLIGANGAQHASFDQDKQIMTYQEVNYEANIWLLDVASQQFDRIIHSTKYDNYPEFSSDGKSFLFSSNRQDQSSIWRYDFNTQKEQLVLSLKGKKLIRPSWHSNGKEILMTINDDRGYGSLLYNLETRQYHELAFAQGHFAAIEHQGDFFALSKSANVNNRILRLAGQTVSVLPIESVARFMVLSDGRLVYSKTNQDGLFVYDLTTSKEQLITANVDSSALNLWTAVNQAVYFDQNGSNPLMQAGIWRIDINSGEQQFITSHRPYSVGTSLSVNRDETKVLITRTDRAESDVFVTQIN